MNLGNSRSNSLKSSLLLTRPNHNVGLFEQLQSFTCQNGKFESAGTSLHTASSVFGRVLTPHTVFAPVGYTTWLVAPT